jgi:hypothetical protein
VDATSTKSGPWQNANLPMMLYYICCILVAGYLIINIFVGVFVDCYNAAASEMEATKKNEKISKSKMQEIFDDPGNMVRLAIFQTMSTSAFDMFIAAFIVLNIITVSASLCRGPGSMTMSIYVRMCMCVCVFFFMCAVSFCVLNIVAVGGLLPCDLVVRVCLDALVYIGMCTRNAPYST